MKKEKILKKWVSNSGTRLPKITILGLKSLFGNGPRIIPYVQEIYQKKSSGLHTSRSRSMDFNPSDYEASDYKEGRRMAYEDALNHRNLYRELIKSRVYPTGTKVRVKKGRHSNAYILELSMPGVEELSEKIRKKKFDVREGFAGPEEVEEMLNQRRYVQGKIEDITSERGKIQSEGQKYDPDFSGDLSEPFNYGIDRDGRTVYFDQQVIKGKLPFKARKERDLEGRTFVFIGSFLAGIAISTLSIRETGNVIGNLTGTTSGLLGIFLFIFGIVGLVFNSWKKKSCII